MLIQKGPQTDAQKTLYGDKPLDSQMASICPMFSMMPFSRGYDKDNFPRLAGSRTLAQRCRRESDADVDLQVLRDVIRALDGDITNGWTPLQGALVPEMLSDVHQSAI